MEYSIKIITEKEFVKLADRVSSKMLNFVTYFSGRERQKLSKRFYVAVVKESIELEDFLDDHGARKNKTWIYYGEIVASIRNVSSTAYIVSHILSRIKFYGLNDAKTNNFIKDARKRLLFLNDSILSLFAHMGKEAKALGLTLPAPNINEGDFEETLIVKILPQNIHGEPGRNINEDISRVAKEFINSFNKSSDYHFNEKLPLENLGDHIVPDKINEETLRNIQTLAHNAQSMYDTYIQKTPEESGNKDLTNLRGHIAVNLHLLDVAKELCHFYERHETSIRKEVTRKKISKIIQGKSVLDTIVNFAMHYYTIFVIEGYEIANKILEAYTVRDQAVVRVPEGLGFHLRPSTLVAKIANQYGSKLTMIVSDKEFDACSVIDIMWAGGMIKKEGITEIKFIGDAGAIRDLRILAGVNYGEDTMGNSTPLPEDLSYLRQD